MSPSKKILVIGDENSQAASGLPENAPGVMFEHSQTIQSGLTRLTQEEFAGIYIPQNLLTQTGNLALLEQNQNILEAMPDGVVLLNAENNSIIWTNQRFRTWCGKEKYIGENFYSVLNNPLIQGPDYCPFNTAVATRDLTSTSISCGDGAWYQLNVSPIFEGDEEKPKHLVVTVRNITQEKVQQEKLKAIHEAGQELADLTPNELADMTVEQRIDYLKSNILHYTQDLLQFDVVEIRLLDSKTGRLEPLLAVGMTPEAEQRVIMAQPQANGVTGYVAATGKRYLCENTTDDPLYLEGCKGANSSLTVPLILHDSVIGTFNVESPKDHAFSENDALFLEIFTRDVAQAINTLFLLEAEKANTAVQSVEAIHSAVALPIDVILNEAVTAMENYIGHDPEVTKRLQNILRYARDIKHVIQKVGQRMTPAQALPANKQVEKRPLLRGKQILVIDADETVRNSSHTLLERYDCVVETAHDGNEAVCMVRSKLTMESGYDVIIADISLPDINGFDLMMKLRELVEPLPLILMAGYGYDPHHSIPKARTAGLPTYAALCKPFRLDQLLSVIEKVITTRQPAASN